MKASDIKLAPEPPHTFTLGPRSFVATWSGRPTGPLKVGMRLASGDEQHRIAAEATARADLLLPKRSHEDPRWMTIYDVARIHYLLGTVLTHPTNVNAPLWGTAPDAAHVGEQDGTMMMREAGAKEGDPSLVSTRFTDDGLARLMDEYDALAIRTSEVWPELSAEDVRKLGARLEDGSFFDGLDVAAKSGNTDARLAAAQLRRLLSYVVQLRTYGPRGTP
jgi:hypothetical protein